MSESAKAPSALSGIVKTLNTGRELPFVSVVTPTWNRAAFLPYLLYIYRRQDYPADRRELVILDDSPQSNLPIIQRLTQGHPEKFNIRYIHHPERLALGKKRNMLNELANGEYILCMDDDDYYPADKISYTIGMMQKHRALISGSDQIPIWYSHINRIFKTHSFGKHHILNGTFCYHRNYLKKHRYDDECSLAEEVAFTNNYTVSPLQLPCERTILCISHSHNTFDKDFILGSNMAMDINLEQWVNDPMLKNWYQSLHNATHNQPLQWDAIDQVMVINLDKREDRLAQITQELTLLNVPAEKITRIAASEEENGKLGRSYSHLRALQLARKEGWNNYLLLEDDAVLLKQEKHTRVLNSLLGTLPRLPWEVILLGGEIKRGAELKSLNGLIHAGDCNKVCAYLVNSRYYATLEQQMRQDPSDELEARWQALLREGKWLACYPSISYQHSGYSDIEKQETDNIRYYFNKINQKLSDGDKQFAAPAHNGFSDTIGFFMETAAHYETYRPIIAELQSQGQPCALLVNDRVEKQWRDGMQEIIKTIGDTDLRGNLLSTVLEQRQRYKCLVSPYYKPELNGLAEIHVRAIHGLGNEEWSHAWWNTFYHQILCFSHHSQQALNINGNAQLVGNPRFDDWYSADSAMLPMVTKPTLLYIPTDSKQGSIRYWADKLEKLGREYHLTVKIHHDIISHADEKETSALIRRNTKKSVASHGDTLTLLKHADYVLTDNSESIFDAIHGRKRFIILNTPTTHNTANMQSDDAILNTLEPHLRQQLPVAEDIIQLKAMLSAEYDWPGLERLLEDVRVNYCDAFHDGKSASRAAKIIISTLSLDDDKSGNALLRSLRNKLF